MDLPSRPVTQTNDEPPLTSSVADCDRAADRRPIAELLILALPTVAQMASYTAMNFTDTWMLSRLGLVEPTASANASLFGFALISVGFGDDVGRQHARLAELRPGRCAGERTVPVGGRLVRRAVRAAGAAADPAGPGRCSTPSATSRGWRRWRRPTSTSRSAVTALRLAGAAMGQFLLAIDRPNLTLTAALVAVVANIFANYALIFGHFGLPAMGLAGAAWGTNVAALVEVGMLTTFILLPRIRTTYRTLEWRPTWARFRTLLKIGLPSGFQMIGDVMAWAVFGMWVMAFFGTGGDGGEHLYDAVHADEFPADVRPERGRDGAGRAVHRPGDARRRRGAGRRWGSRWRRFTCSAAAWSSRCWGAS